MDGNWIMNLKKITGFNWVIDLIDHFSKFLMSEPIIKNNADNEYYLLFKEYFTYIDKPKIFQ